MVDIITACRSLVFSNCATCLDAEISRDTTCLTCDPGYALRDDKLACVGEKHE